jgi:chromosome partitioning protein
LLECKGEDSVPFKLPRVKTIIVNSQKGGSGKTTLCANLSVEAERVGDGPVYLIDLDTQGTLSTWHEKRENELPRRVEIPLADLERGLPRLEQHGAALCLIDTAPSRNEETAHLFRLADLVLVPIRPSPSDLWAASATVELLKREAIPFLFVLNQVKANAGITGQAAASLSHHGRVAETFIGDRVPYAAALTNGLTAMELDRRGPAAVEMASLWKNIQACLNGNMQHAKDMKLQTIKATIIEGVSHAESG